MPLGKISKNMITSAYKVLTDALAAVKGPQGPTTQSQVIALSNHFYTLVPHDFGKGTAPLLDNENIIKAKRELLEALTDLEITTTLLKSGTVSEEDPVDVHYRSLKTEMEVVPHDSVLEIAFEA